LTIETVSMQLFPNPTNAQLNIILDNSDNNVNAMIFDLNGRITWTGELNAGSSQVDVAGLAPGMYYLQIVTNDGQRLTQKFIKSE
ncbi:MAG: T9SS type A sorting domain-containing protein, partial [Bacteroidota bacterium]